VTKHEGNCNLPGHQFMPMTKTRVYDENKNAWVVESVTSVFCARCGKVMDLYPATDEGDDPVLPPGDEEPPPLV